VSGVGGTFVLISEIAAFIWFGSRTMEGRFGVAVVVAGDGRGLATSVIVEVAAVDTRGGDGVDTGADVVIGGREGEGMGVVVGLESSTAGLFLSVVGSVPVLVVLSDLFDSSFSFGADIVH